MADIRHVCASFTFCYAACNNYISFNSNYFRPTRKDITDVRLVTLLVTNFISYIELLKGEDVFVS